MFNNNMFGNQQSMRPNFMGAMQRRQSWMDRGAGNMSRPVSNAGYADVGTPKWGVRPAAYPFPSPDLPENRANAINSMPNGNNAFQPFMGRSNMPNGNNAFQPFIGSNNMPNGVNAFQKPDTSGLTRSIASGASQLNRFGQNVVRQKNNAIQGINSYMRTPSPESTAESEGVFGQSVSSPQITSSTLIPQGIIQRPENSDQAIASQAYQRNRQFAAANAPQYINPTGRAIQSQLAQSNQSLAGTLNQRLDRRFDINPGATAESNVQRQLAGGMIPTSSGFQPRQDTGEARNVLAGQPMGLDRTMRALNIPGMHLEGNRMIKDAPQAIGGANVPARGLGGMTPNQFRNYQEIARRDGGPAGVEAALANGFGADGEENAGIGILNRQAQIMKRNPDGVNTGLSSNYQNVKDSRMARRMGFGSVSSFRNFMNQYNARQNRVASPFGVGATAGAMATQGLLQGRSGKSGQESSASEKNNGTLLPLDAIKQQAKFSVGQLSRVPSRVERAANDATTTSINGVFSGPGFGFPGMRFLR